MATFNPECMDGKGGFGCIGSLERPDTFNGCQWCGSGQSNTASHLSALLIISDLQPFDPPFL
jgi:hypothetical protein